MDCADLSPRPAAVEHRFYPGVFRRTEVRVGDFRQALLEALRIAGGLGLTLSLRWATGPRGSIDLRASGAGSAKWMGSMFAACYGPGQWRTRPPSSAPGSAPGQRYGIVEVGESLPRLPMDLSWPWSQAVYRALGELPPGTWVEWVAEAQVPGSRTAPQPPPLEARAVPPGFRMAPLTSLERSIRDRAAERTLASWQVSLRAGGPVGRLIDLRRVCAVIQAASRSGLGSRLTWVRPVRWVRPHPPRFPMLDDEWAALLPEPDCRPGFASSGEVTTAGLPIGWSNRHALIRLPVPPSEGRHLCLLGETGMGKSTSLVTLALSAARQHGLVLFDPIGDTASEFVARLPAPARSRLLEISPVTHPVSLNALDGLREPAGGPFLAEKSRLDLVAALRRVRSFRFTETAFWGPRIEEILGRALDGAAAIPHGTLVDAQWLLEGLPPRDPRGLDDAGRRAGDELRELARRRPDEVDGTRRLLAEVTTNEVLRRLLCAAHPDRRPEDLVAPGSITVLSGEAPRTGEGTARYLLAIELALLWPLLLARPGGAKTFLVLDEAQWYAHDSVAEILRLGRRSNVHLVLATQGLGSLIDPVREAVLANVADFLLFRGAPEDAREFARWVEGIDPGDLLTLGRGDAILLVGKGREVYRLRTPSLAPVPRTPVDAAGDISGPPPPHPPANPSVTTGSVPSTYPHLQPADLVAAAAAHAGPSGLVEFPFRSVRSALEASEPDIRELGRDLRRVGAFVERRRSRSGKPVWLLRAREASRGFPVSQDPERARRALQVWEQLSEGGSVNGQSF